MTSKPETIRVRCSTAFKKGLEKLAKKQKKSVSEMIRDDYNLKLAERKNH